MKHFAFLLIMLVFISCKESKKTNDAIVFHSMSTDKNFEYSVNFPDTVYVNEPNDGEFQYKSPLDTITKNFSDPRQNRYVVFRTLPDNTYDFHRDFFNDSLQEYRIGATDNRSIPFYDLSFKTTGVFEINGLINDLVLIEPQTENNQDKTKIRLIEEDFPVSFKVVVIDRISN
ncbi:hypothetical protein LB465_14015 [Salegentibacter sp. LM13S]|uniref:hypothetical protein n=1 Tax=Salegentibacter lacus TaxID=2873599 RepID=UPI001CC95F00|nr:hypothetical protein [Salegentibacter lacus]MBZ9631900.1 hypothetical protein [Salegentibacter lacus]